MSRERSSRTRDDEIGRLGPGVCVCVREKIMIPLSTLAVVNAEIFSSFHRFRVRTVFPLLPIIRDLLISPTRFSFSNTTGSHPTPAPAPFPPADLRTYTANSTIGYEQYKPNMGSSAHWRPRLEHSKPFSRTGTGTIGLEAIKSATTSKRVKGGKIEGLVFQVA